jgi:hypothetical protein
MIANSYLVSEKTGIPVLAIYISRASTTQSVKDLAVVLEPYRPYEILNDIKDKRPFLLTVARCNELTEYEKNIVRSAVPVDSNNRFILYSLERDSLAALPQKHARSVTNFVMNKNQNPDTTAIPYLKHSFEGQVPVKGYIGAGMQVQGRSVTNLADTSFLTDSSEKQYSASFWLNPIDKDQVPKTRLRVELYDKSGKRYSYLDVMCGDWVKTFDGNWGLIEFPFTCQSGDDRIQITVYNDIIHANRKYTLDEFLLRPASSDIAGSNDQFVFLNNRYFSLHEK